MGQRLRMVERLLLIANLLLRPGLCLFKLFAFGNVQMDAGGANGGSAGIAYQNFPAIVDPVPSSRLVTQSMFAAIYRGFSSQVSGHGLHDCRFIVGMDQPLPGPHMRFDLRRLVPQHCRPPLVEDHLAAGNVPIPGADSGALHDHVDLFGLGSGGFLVHPQESFQLVDARLFRIGAAQGVDGLGAADG